MTESVEYRLVMTTEEMEQVVDAELSIWGGSPRDAVPMSIMRPMAQYGGAVIAAFTGGRVVGISLMFPARRHSRWVLWSHQAGVLPGLQGRGIGFGLKQAQRTWALDHGYKEICWTYDPLLRGNSNFNLHRLGATASNYLVDYYGPLHDGINLDAPSDRVEAVWKLTDRRVARLASGASPLPFIKQPPAEAFLLSSDARGYPALADRLVLPESWAFVQIPRNFSALDGSAPAAWRIAVRTALQTAFAAGFVAVDLADDGETAAYILRPPEHWYLYVVRCSDESLYTGISPNVAQRIKTHNAGRGAAYTAARRPVSLLAAWRFPGRSAALKAEIAFKRLARAKKLELIANINTFAKILMDGKFTNLAGN